MDRFDELAQEFRSVVAGRARWLDTIVPPLLFLIMNAWLGFRTAAWAALAAGGVITLLRLARRESPLYALGGIGGAALAAGLAWLSGTEAGYFLPGIVTGVLTVAALLVSIAARRPLVAWTSHLARRWPRGWYWHPRVRPAYTQVTWIWFVYFGLRTALQLYLFGAQATGALAAVQIALGWPATVVLLAVSYLYGTWRLRALGGPSVSEFEAGTPPPWQGQQRGF
ncbi:MAG: DUF3159 domain-containing protein [Anaerolineae bacterium]|nr:DUF3159 domain-containing protein [Anaerolineae bacterium]